MIDEKNDPEAALHALVYVASRASIPARPSMWRHLRDTGAICVVSTWIDVEEVEDYAALWWRAVEEVKKADLLILYVERGDLPIKGGLVEVGVALGNGIPVYVVAPDGTEGIGSWIEHSLVEIFDSIDSALPALDAVLPSPARRF